VSEAISYEQEVVYRPAHPMDVNEVVRLGLMALEENAYEELVIDVDKVRQVAIEGISGAQHFCWVADRGGRLVAAVGALVHPMTFYERNQATVVQFYATEPGTGLPLIRRFLEWARARRGIKMIQFTLEPNSDPRLPKMLERLGLKRDLPVYVEMR